MSAVFPAKVMPMCTYVHIPTQLHVCVWRNIYVYVCKAISAGGKLDISLLKQNISVFYN